MEFAVETFRLLNVLSSVCWMTKPKRPGSSHNAFIQLLTTLSSPFSTLKSTIRIVAITPQIITNLDRLQPFAFRCQYDKPFPVSLSFVSYHFADLS